MVLTFVTTILTAFRASTGTSTFVPPIPPIEYDAGYDLNGFDSNGFNTGI